MSKGANNEDQSITGRCLPISAFRLVRLSRIVSTFLVLVPRDKIFGEASYNSIVIRQTKRWKVLGLVIVLVHVCHYQVCFLSRGYVYDLPASGKND